MRLLLSFLCLLFFNSFGAVKVGSRTDGVELLTVELSQRVERVREYPLYPSETTEVVALAGQGGGAEINVSQVKFASGKLNHSPLNDKILIQIFYPELLDEEFLMVA
jgi:hypothetical protein